MKKWFFLAVMSISLLGIISCGVSTLEPKDVVGNASEVVIYANGTTDVITGTAMFYYSKTSSGTSTDTLATINADVTSTLIADNGVSIPYYGPLPGAKSGTGTSPDTTGTYIMDTDLELKVTDADGKVYTLTTDETSYSTVTYSADYVTGSVIYYLSETDAKNFKTPAKEFTTANIPSTIKVNICNPDLNYIYKDSTGTVSSFEEDTLWMTNPTGTFTLTLDEDWVLADDGYVVVYDKIASKFDLESKYTYGGEGENYSVYYSVQEDINDPKYGAIATSASGTGWNISFDQTEYDTDGTKNSDFGKIIYQPITDKDSDDIGLKVKYWVVNIK